MILENAARHFLALDRPELAQALADLGLSVDPANADLQSVAAHILDCAGDWEGSLALLRRAHELAPHAPQVRLNLAMALLRLGYYREGFTLYEARIEKASWSGFATAESRLALRDRILLPGQTIEGKRILLLAEQGLGDSIMFSRYIPMLAKGGARPAVACNPTLRPYFARVAGIENLLAPPADQPLAQINLAALAFDAWAPLLSLALWFGTVATTVPAELPCWSPDRHRVAHWRQRLAGMGRPRAAKVGLVFQASPGGASYAEKSMSIGEILPLLAGDAVDFVNLQHGPAGRELAQAAPCMIDPLPNEVPLDEYAAAIAATDLLISVDTMAAHCAGAMGHPTWLAVPHSPHWAWGLKGETTPWYPSLRIFRQAKRRNWPGVIATVTTQLREKFVAGATAAPDQTLGTSSGAATRPLPLGRPRADDREAAAGLADVARALAAGRQGDHARKVAELAARLDGANESRHDIMADILEQDSDWDNALLQRRAAAASGAAIFRLKLASARLLRGELAQGFADYEARRAVPLWVEQALPTARSLAALAGKSLKPGDPLDGRHIVVFTEQGLGDTFFGMRFLPMLAERGPRITLVCRAPMRPFFARLPFLDAILSPPEDQPASKIDLAKVPFDAFCPLLSLPFVMGTADPADAPRAPYLGVDPAQAAAWRARYQREGRSEHRKIGLVWRANPSNFMLSNRSMSPQDLAPLARLNTIDWVNLQDGPVRRDLRSVLPNLIEATHAPLPLDEFAAALAATDLVLTVDTMAAHCAGALGHPVFVALTNVPAWYWGLKRSDCSWYPAARLFRCSATTDWTQVISAIAADLAKHS